MEGLEKKILGKSLPQIKQISLSEITNIKLNLVSYYNKKYSQLYYALILCEILDEEEMEIAFENAIFAEAKKDYENILKDNKDKKIKIYPQDLESPQCFAYAISKNQYSEDELLKVHFGYSQNREEFVRKYARETLPKIITREFLSAEIKPENKNR